MELLYATTNPGKLDEVSKYLGNSVPLRSPADYEISLDVAETGETLEENARLKAEAYRELVPGEVVVMADDTGLEIDALGGEPGVKVRRWIDGETEATDQEIIDHCLTRLAGIPAEERGAQFRTVIALLPSKGELRYFDGVLRGSIATENTPINHPGFPFRGLFKLEDGTLLGELEDRPDPDHLTHRQRAVQKAADWLKDYNKAT